MLHIVHTEADVHVLQLLGQDLQVPELKIYPELQEVHPIVDPDLMQVRQFEITH